MRVVLDTSVLVAGICESHPHYAPSARLLDHRAGEKFYITTHALAECFSVLTRLPQGFAVTPQEALLCTQRLKEHCAVIPIEEMLYLVAMERIISTGMSGSAIYDALHVCSAENIGAAALYTWNLKHFQRLAVDSPVKIMTPPHAD